MLRPRRAPLRFTGLVCLATLVVACIQRKLDCPPVNGPGGSASSVAGTGASLVGPTWTTAFAVQGEKEKVAVESVAVQGQAFSQGLRASVKKGSGHEYAVQIAAPTVQAVEEGDVMLATFYVRAETPLEGVGAAQTQFVFEQAHEPYNKSVVYDIQAGPEWRKISVPFVAKQKFSPSEAQMIFRLGYDPEVFDIAGVVIENFGKKVKLASLPTTRHWTPPKQVDVLALEPIDGGPLAIDVDTSAAIGPISPYVYGVNSQPADGLGVTVRRMGGNRQTAYNWETNASNAGSDYRHVSDDWPCTSLGYKNCNEPGAQFLDFAADNKRLGAETLATIPLLDYVAADKNHEVSDAEKAPSKRWLRSSPHKNGPHASAPDLNDGAVYQDEFVDFLVHKLGSSAQGGIKFYSLDNEPGLWPSTHPRIHADKTTYHEMVARTEALATEITSIDPAAVLLGGVMYGWNEYTSLVNAPDAKEVGGRYETYTDFFLASMNELERKHQRRLVHVLDIHWYPEARGIKRITDADNSPKTVDARLQAPRAMWDPTYREKSWIDDEWKKPIRLIPWMKEKIAKNYPGTKLSMTEYDFGGGDHVSGGLAQADVLGVFGREGMYLADYWGNGPGNGDLPAYIAAAFRLYRNYDGKGGTYGDTAVKTKAPDVTKTSVFAATDSKRPKLLTVLVINKDQRARYAARVAIAGGAKYGAAQVFRLDKTSPQIQAAGNVEIHDNRIEYTLPPLSATLFVCERR
jgi:hypothetical protein